MSSYRSLLQYRIVRPLGNLDPEESKHSDFPGLLMVIASFLPKRLVRYGANLLPLVT
jgi:hypothetical protein